MLDVDGFGEFSEKEVVFFTQLSVKMDSVSTVIGDVVVTVISSTCGCTRKSFRWYM